MKVFASITLSIFYCLFLSSGENVYSSVSEIDSDHAPSYTKEIFSQVKKSVCKHGCVKQVPSSETPIVGFTAFLFILLFFWDIQLLHPRTLRIKSGLSPPF